MTGFVQISKAKIPLLYSTVEKRIPSSSSAPFYNIVHTFLNKRFSKNVETTFYTYNEIIDDDSLFAAVQKRKFKTETDVAITLSGPSNLSILSEEMIRQFEEGISWEFPICFCLVDEKLVEHLKLLEMCKRRGKLVDVDPCHLYWMSMEDALKFNTDQQQSSQGEVINIAPLEIEDAQTVRDSWKFSGPGTLERMQDAISTIPGSAGIRLLKDSHSTLTSWVMMFHGGSINALFTDENHRRKGYGKLTMQGACLFTAQAGTIPNVQIELFNDASKKLMEEIGFFYAHQVNWVIYEPQK